MKANELREMTEIELENMLNDYKEELFNLRFQASIGQLDNPLRIREVRKNIARVKTVLHQKNKELA